MNAKDVIKLTIGNSDFIANSYLADLSDADLMLRPVDGMNHLAWQIGHLIAAERHFMEAIKPGASPALPEGFEEAHNKETISSDDPKKFRTKDEYLSLWKKQREATLKVLDGMTDAQLETPSPENFRGGFAPTHGSLLNLVGIHPLMHCGQWVSVRRKLKKPISI